MADNAFARCKGFLNYHSLAKWFSIFAAVGSAILYLGLIALLGFFIDLMVQRGDIPSFHQLPDHERRLFLSENVLPEEHDKRADFIRLIKAELEALKFDPTQLQSWEKEPVEKWTAREKALLWWAKMPHLLKLKVGDDAEEKAPHQQRQPVSDDR